METHVSKKSKETIEDRLVKSLNDEALPKDGEDVAAWYSDGLDKCGQVAMLHLLCGAASNFSGSLCDVFYGCESPIEHALLAAVIVQSDYVRFGKKQPPVGAWDRWVMTVESQKEIDNYRADIFLTYTDQQFGGSVTMVVECDGHEFHEKTKEQAAKDKSRDRALQSLGHLVFRFTGSEVWASPGDCATEVTSAMHRAWKRMHNGGK